MSNVSIMFDHISGNYDKLNGLLSLNRDKAWRKTAVESVKSFPGAQVLDLCGGTGELLASWVHSHGLPAQGSFVGDFSHGMLSSCHSKYPAFLPTQVDATNLPLKSECYDFVLNGFGMRNVAQTSLEKGIQEVERVLRPGGKFVTLEFFKPAGIIPRFFYNTIGAIGVPFYGKIFAKSSGSYKYLIRTIQQFLTVEEYAQKCEEQGLEVDAIKRCDKGMAWVVVLKKPNK